MKKRRISENPGKQAKNKGKIRQAREMPHKKAKPPEIKTICPFYFIMPGLTTTIGIS
jgi:hypothetical protein